MLNTSTPILRRVTKVRTCLILFLLAFFLLRFSFINNTPLFGDEIDVGNQAYSLLKTGRDYRGNLFPTYIQSFSESRAPLLMYLTIPFIAIFGQNSLGVRLPPLLFSLLALYFFYLLVKKVSKNKPLALIAVFIMGTSPIFFHYSALAFESSLLLLLVLAGIYYYLENKWLLSFMLFALSFYTYNTANVFTPLILLFLFISHLKQIKNYKRFFLSTLPALFLLLPLIYQIVFGSAASRFSLISIFGHQNTETVEIKRSSAPNPYSISEKIFHNRPREIVQVFFKNYLTSFSPQTLFISGDSNPRHSVPGFGFLLLSLALLSPLIFFSKPDKLFIYWLFIAPIASSLTLNGGEHATRLFIVIPAIVYLYSLAFSTLWSKSKTISYLFLIALIFCFLSFLHEYRTHYPKDHYQSWGYGYQEVFQNEDLKNYPLYISNPNYNLLNPYLFYQKPDLRILQSGFIDQPKLLTDGLEGYELDRTRFIINWHGDTLETIKNIAKPGDIFVLTQLKDIPGDMILDKFTGFNLINVIKTPLDQPLYQIIQKQ